MKLRRLVSSLRTRLLVLAVIAFTPAFAVAIHSGIERRDGDAAHATEELSDATRLASGVEQQLIGTTRDLLGTLSQLPELHDRDACNRLLGKLAASSPQYAALGAADLNGDVYCASLPLPAEVLNIAGRAYFADAIRTKGFSLGEYQVDRLTKRPTLNAGYPLVGEDGRAGGAVYAALDLRWLTDVLGSVDLPGGTFGLVLDHQGNVLASWPPGQAPMGASPGDHGFLWEMEAHGDGSFEAPGPDGSEHLYAARHLGDAGVPNPVHVVMGVPKAAVFASANAALRDVAISLLLSLVVMLAVSGLAGEFFVRGPVGRLVDASRRLKGGDLTARTGMSPEGEFGRLASTFDEMASAIQDHDNRLLEAYDETLSGWARALELRDYETAGHSERVVKLTLELARHMGVDGEELVHLRRGALLHDIGKMAIPDAILLKPGELTPEEWEVMRQHPVFGQRLLERVPFLRPAIAVTRHHHERWDGKGYPDGLQGAEIPFVARIFAVADVYDALRYDRPYRKGWEEGCVIMHLQSIAGSQLDPQAVEMFVAREVWREGQEASVSALRGVIHVSLPGPAL